MPKLAISKRPFVFRAFARVNPFLLAVGLSFLTGALGLAQEAAVFSQSDSSVPTNKIVAKIPVAVDPAICVVSPDNTTLYVNDDYSGLVSVIDTATNKVTFKISPGGPLTGMALTPDGTQLYVVNDASGSGPYNTVSVINTKTKTVSATVNIAEASYLTVTPDGKSVWVSNGSEIAIIDTATNQISGTISTPASTLPEQLVFSPDGSEAYVLFTVFGAAGSGDGLLKIDTATQKSVQLYWGKLHSAWGIAIAPDGGKLYFSEVPPRNTLTGQVVVFNTAQDKIETKILLRHGIFQCAVTPNGKYVYAASDPTVMIDTATNLVVGEPIPLRSVYVTIAPNGRHAYLLDGKRDVYVVDISPAQ